jgi:dTDP-4-dehydrorhamnose 3,5-epimerase
LADASTVAFLVTSPFSLSNEFEINPLDPEIGIDWGLPDRELPLSPADKAAPSLKEQLGVGKLPWLGLCEVTHQLLDITYEKLSSISHPL